MHVCARSLGAALVIVLGGCGDPVDPLPAPASATSVGSSSAPPVVSASAAPPGPVDIYCGAIEEKWKELDALCTVEQRKLSEWSDARAAITEAVTMCKALLGPSHAAGRVGFEKAGSHRPACYVPKLEWAVLPNLTRLDPSCSPLILKGLVADASQCSHSYECRSGVCNKGVCTKPLPQDADCSAVDRTIFDRAPACDNTSYCDRDVEPPLVGYPKSTILRRTDFEIRSGRISIEPTGPASAAKPAITKWANEMQPYLRRCFEAALMVDAKAKGSLTLDLSSNAVAAVVASDLPEALRDCAARVSSQRRFPEQAARVELRFLATANEKRQPLPAPTGKCMPYTGIGQSCVVDRECGGGFSCTDWKCAMEGVRDCRTDEACYLNERCLRGHCIERIPPGQPCTDSADCRGTVCISGTCQPMCATKHGPDFSIQ